MAVVAHHLTTGSDSANGTTYTTASISPNAGRLILCAVEVSVGTAPTPSVSLSGCGVAWVQVIANVTGPSVLESRTIHLFRAMGTPTTGALTITAASAVTAAIWQVAEFSGVDTSGTDGSGAVVQSVRHRSDGVDVTSVSKAFGSAVTGGNASYGAVAIHSVQEALTAGSGWTALGQATVGGPQSSMLGEFAAAAEQNITASWTTATDVFLVGAEIKAATGDTTPPSVPASVAVVADSATQVTVSWTASTDDTAVASYRVRRDGSDLAGAAAVVGTSYVDTTVSPTTAYSYTVSAVDAAGNRSDESAAGSVTTPAASTVQQMWNGTDLVPVTVGVWDGSTLITVGNVSHSDDSPPTTPTGLAATAVNPTRIDLSWTASTDDSQVDGYRVRRGGAIVGDATGTGYTDTTVSPTTSYTYTVQAYDDAGNYSAESASAGATTPAVTDTSPPSVPSGVTAAAVSSSRIDLAWNPSTDDTAVSHYVVLRGGEVIDARVTSTQYAATGLSPSTLYSFTVQAVDTSGNTSDESSSASATTDADSSTPGPTPTGDFVIGVTASQLQALPRSGTEWANLKRQADGSYGLVKDDGATDGSGNAVAGALVYVATGDTAYRDRVLAAVNAVEASGTAGWWHAAVNRKLGGWALAAHLIGHETTAWHNFLESMLTQTNGGPGRSSQMHHCAWNWDNNHGGAAMGSYIMICAILGLTGSNVTVGGTPGGLYHANKWLRGWLGDHTSTGFGHANSTNPSYGSMGVTGEAQNRGWHMDESKPYGVGPTTAMWGSTVPLTRDGAVPSDVVRGTTLNHPTVGSAAPHYVYGNAGRRSVGAIVLAGMGYPDIWTVADDALYRWRAWCARQSMPPEGANNLVYDPIIRKVYGGAYDTTGFTATSQSSEVITGTEWLALIPEWPVRPTTLP